MDSDILVDGYNVIKNNPMFRSLELKSRAEARNVLIRQLKNRYRHTAHRVIVVFDGDGVHEQVSHDDHIRIIFSRYGEKADQVIMRLAAEGRRNGHSVDLYSNDGEIRHVVVQEGGSVHTTQQLTAKLNAPPAQLAQLAKHRQEMRRIYGIDPSYKPEDDEDPYPPTKHKKRKPSRRRRRR